MIVDFIVHFLKKCDIIYIYREGDIMTITKDSKIKKGRKVGEKICQKYGIGVKVIEKRDDLYSKDLTAIFEPKKRKTEIKLKVY